MIENKRQIINQIKEFRKIYFNKFQYFNTEEYNLLDLIKLENGSQPPKEQHIYEFKDGYIRFVQNRDYSSDSHITYIPISKKNHICNKTDIMMDKYGEAGCIRYGIEGAYNVALLKIIPSSKNLSEYIRDFLSQNSIQNILFMSSQASTRPSLNESTFNALKIKLPNDDNLTQYEFSMNKLLEYEFNQKKYIDYLIKIKQYLLSKYF